MTCVPEYGLLHSTLRPTAFENSSSISCGNPFGKVGIGFLEINPAISQCPVVVSLPADCSVILANTPSGAAYGVFAVTPSILNNPSFSIFGMENSGLFATVPRVLLPSSPYFAASGISPIPKLSRTIKNTRFICCSSLSAFFILLPEKICFSSNIHLSTV